MTACEIPRRHWKVGFPLRAQRERPARYFGTMVTGSADIAAYLEDSSGYKGRAERVVAPSNVEEVREIVVHCTREHIALTVAGAGTGLTGARVPHGGWVLSLERFRNVEVVPGRAICGAALTLADLQTAAGKTKQFLGPNPTETSASVGGVVSTNAGGARSFHYGSVRRHVLALEATFMNGHTQRLHRGDRINFPAEVVRTPATSKNAAGYDLHPDVEWVDLLAGSEGTLAIITEVELQMLPEPPEILSGVVFFPTDELALEAVDAWRGLPELRLLEYLDAAALHLLQAAYPDIPARASAALLVEQNVLSAPDDAIDLWANLLEKQDALAEESWFGFSAADRERFRQFRHTLPSIVVDRARRNGYPKYGTDFAVPIRRHRELHAFYRRRCEEEFPAQYTIFGHIGDANNHVNLMPATPEQARRGEGLIYEFAEIVVSLGGTVAAEHGIGKSKTDLLRLMYTPQEIDAMSSVKRHLDPDWLLGQGTIFEMPAQ